MASKSKKRYADGGKVSNFRRLSKLLRDRYKMDLHTYGEYGENTPEYNRIIKNWDPRMAADDAELLTDYGTGALWNWQVGSDEIKRMDELIKKHGIRPRGYTLWRGMEVAPDRVDTLFGGNHLFSPRQTSTSLNEHTAREFSTMGAGERGAYPTLIRIAPTEKLALPLPTTGQSELIFPSGEAGQLLIDKVNFSPRSRTFEIDAEALPHPGFSEGGQVLPSSTDEGEDWSDTYLKRPLAGLASMWGGTDPETGEFISPAVHNLKRAWNADERRRQGLPPQQRASLGIVDETMSIPALGGLVGLPVPEFAEEAEGRASDTRAAAQGAVGVDAPHGFTENLMESAGVMAGQLPVPASAANRLKLLKESGSLGKVGKVLSPAVEWFSPTVVPKAANYIKGALFGGTLGGGLDHAEDYLDEREQKERHKQFISEAIAEVLEEERQKQGEESGSEETDDEALAELGYAEGGRVKTAKRVIGSLRSILAETDVEDVNARKAHIDQALNSIRSTTGPSEMERTHLHTMVGGLSDAAADPNPARRRQRFGDYESNVLALLEGRVAPQLAEKPVPRLSAQSNMPPPPPRTMSIDEPARGTLTDDEWAAKIARVKGFAKGGTVNNPWESPQAQKEEMLDVLVPGKPTKPTTPTVPGVPTTSQGRQGSPLSQEWYETYGAGPEHLFMGDRTVKLHDMWGPQRPGAVPPPHQNPQGSWLPAAGIVGFSLYDEWKKRRAEGEDTSESAFWQSMHNSAANTSDSDAWVNQQLEEYGADMAMPVMNDDGSVSYVQPNQFWSNIHKSAADTSDTDAWVNSQLEDYRTNGAMPIMNDDGTVSYVDKDGNPVQSGGASGLGRAWSGATGAYDMYSGINQGGVEGYAQALSGANDLYGSITGGSTGALGTGTGVVSGLASVYGGIDQGGVQGYTQAAGGALQTANSLGYNVSAAGGAAGAAAKAVPLIGAAISAYGTYESAKVGDKKSAVAQGAAAGAAIGSVIPGIGTAIGAVVGALVGLVGAALGNKQQASEAYYGAHKNLKPEQMIRGWSEDQVNGAVFETIKSHTKSGNVNKFKDVGEMYTAFGITKDAHKNYKNVQTQMGEFMKGVVQTAQQMGSLPTDPTELRQLDGQQIYYKVIVPAMAAKYKEATGKDSEGWTVDKVTAGSNSKMHALMADWTDWMTSHWGQKDQPAPQSSAAQGGGRTGGARALERARGGRVNTFDYNPRSGALSLMP